MVSRHALSADDVNDDMNTICRISNHIILTLTLLLFFQRCCADLRLTLDRNVTVVNERAEQPGRGQWCLSDAQALQAQASVVPFNVFEVKLAGSDPMPDGLADAQSDSTMILAQKFSKFTTGAAAFNKVPMLPYWAAEPAFYTFFDLENRAKGHMLSEPDDDSSQDAVYNLMGNDGKIHRIPAGLKIAPKTTPRIEPKTYFANERTFVQWISSAIMLLTVASFMLEADIFGEYKSTAAVISLAAFGLVLYSTRLYFKRLRLLRTQKPDGYFNWKNPAFLTFCVLLAIFLVWADSVRGEDIFSGLEKDDRRRLLRFSMPSMSPQRRALQESSSSPCMGELLDIQLPKSSCTLLADGSALLTAAGDSVFSQTMTDNVENAEKNTEPTSLVRVHDSNLQGLAAVDKDRLFALSSGPHRTELIELSYWGSSSSHQHLRVVARWTLENLPTQVNGFSYVPASNRFYIHMNSSIQVYSVPAITNDQETTAPQRLSSLNMKVLLNHDDRFSSLSEHPHHLSTMSTVENITYLMNSEENILEAWDLAQGALISTVKLPPGKWTNFAFGDELEQQQRRRPSTKEDSPLLLRGSTANTKEQRRLDPVKESRLLYLVSDRGQVWSYATTMIHDSGVLELSSSSSGCS